MLTPSEVKAEAERLEESNYKFRTFLKNRADGKELDELFFDMHNELFADYDCGNCRNCCREYTAVLTKKEIGQIAQFMQMTADDFKRQYITENYGAYEFKEVPCCFLGDDNACQIESCMPRSCKEYPNTNKPGRLSSMLGIVSAASVCPVVFEMLERLKAIYGFRARGSR